MSWFENLFEALQKIAGWRTEYNEKRPYSSLGYQPPAEYARQLATTAGSIPLRGTTPPAAARQGADSANANFV